MKLCQGTVGPRTFFEDAWDDDAQAPVTGPRSTFDEAMALCQLCPHREECAEGAIERREKYGIWGGLTPRQIRSIVRRRAAERGRMGA